MKFKMSIEFNDVLEMKGFLTEPHPFGAFLNNADEVVAAQETVDTVKKTRKTKKKETALADAIQETAVTEAVPVADTAAAPVAPVAPAPVPAAPVAPAPTVAATYTLDDLSRAGAALVETGRQAEVFQVFLKYGVQTLPEIPAEQYAAVAADFRALGAAI